TLVYCGDRSQGLWPAFRRSLRTLALFSMIVIVCGILIWALGLLEGPLSEAGQRTASWLTFHLRKPGKPATWSAWYLAALWAVRWIIVPPVVLPVAGGVALNGTRGVGRKGSRVFWLQYLVALLLGVYIPGLLIHWVPKLTETTAQVLSFAV